MSEMPNDGVVIWDRDTYLKAGLEFIEMDKPYHVYTQKAHYNGKAFDIMQKNY